MKTYKKFAILVTPTICFFLLIGQLSCSHFPSSLTQIGFNSRQERKLVKEPSRLEQKVSEKSVDSKNPLGIERRKVLVLIKAEDFVGLEKYASVARSKKERLPGGYWKLYAFYKEMESIRADGISKIALNRLWLNRISFLKKWKAIAPNSVTPRIALASAYYGYGWFARGHGFSNAVSRENSRLLFERLELARNELITAKKIGDCPHWYALALNIGMVEGMPEEYYEKVFQSAVEFEPNYLSYYLIKFTNLHPKWGGRKSDRVEFINLISQKEDSEKFERDIIYFVLVATMLNEGITGVNWSHYSKNRVQNGFAELEKKYGVDNYRLNQFAYITCSTLDLSNARWAFERIGDDRNTSVWSEHKFNQMLKFSDQVEEIFSR